MTTATTHAVTAADGTAIGFRAIGTGPGVVVLHGSMSSGHNHQELADLLADSFTVYLPDRRGRGLSGPYRPGDGLDTEVGDLNALLDETGVHCVFAVSSGAIIALEAMRRRPDITKAVIFEPPLFTERARAAANLAELDARLGRGDLAAALVTGMKRAEMGPALMRALPDGLLARLTAMAMRGEERKPSEYVSMRALAPTLHHEFQIVVDSAGHTYSDVDADVLLLGGAKSPHYLKDALTRLEQSMPHVRRVELPGLDHGASWNADRRGNPAPVAEQIRSHFGR